MMYETGQHISINAPTTFASLLAFTNATDCSAPRQISSGKGASVNTESPRSEVLNLGAEVGNLCKQILSHAPLDDDNAPDEVVMSSFWSSPSCNRKKIYDAIASVFACLVKISCVCGIDFRSSILKKIDLNGRKYPVELCKGKSGKYTKYSSQTGITKTNQSTLGIAIRGDEGNDISEHSVESPLDTVPAVTGFIRKFAADRKWAKYHTPRNITLAMLGEVGELAELFQWCSEEKVSNAGHGLLSIGWKEQEVDSVQQELADVAIYCLRLADVVGIQDLGYAVLNLPKK